MNVKHILILTMLLLPVDFFAQSVPDLALVDRDMLGQLSNTTWVAVDPAKNKDLYVFFYGNQYGGCALENGEKPDVPLQLFPIKYVQQGRVPYSGIFVVSSQRKLLYYAFAFMTPFYLVISGGYDNLAPLVGMGIEDYLVDGYAMRLVQK